MKKNKISLFHIIFSICLVIIFFFALYFMGLKKWFHMDEIYTYGLSNNYFEPFPWQVGEWLSGDYFT